MSRTRDYERDDAQFPDDAYQVRGFSGVACYVRGWHVEPDEDTEWTGQMARTGFLVVTMVGDDARHLVNPGDVTPLDSLAYCGECGQIGCTHDGREREGD